MPTGLGSPPQGEKCAEKAVKGSKVKLKEVSKAKHRILEKYFPAWARILGSWHPTLVYVDCFAGQGRYEAGELGSPLIITKKAIEVTQKGKFQLLLIFIERDKQKAEQLEVQVSELLKHANRKRVRHRIFNKDARNLMPQILAHTQNMPAFFFIDPYGHPLSIPMMNQILSRPRTEILLNLMWYSINMHLGNPKMRPTLDRMFGHSEWQQQAFMHQSGQEREKSFLEYFLEQMKAKYKFEYRIRFSPEDKTPGGEKRTKYYLIHLSNHPKAVLLIK